MRTQRKLKPGQPGTKKLTAQYGMQLVCVRYRYDAQRSKRYKTAEIIVEEAVWNPRSRRLKDADIVGVRVAFRKVEFQRRVKFVGGEWSWTRQLWDLPYNQALALNLKDRIELEDSPNRRKTKPPNSR